MGTEKRSRDLYLRLTFTTQELHDNQRVQFGFMFKEEEGTVYDAVRASITRYSADQTQNFYLEDFFYSGDPNLTFIISNADATQETVTDWVVVYGDSTVECSDENTCEFSVAFKRNFEISVLMGAMSGLAASSLVAVSALIALTSF